MNYQVSPNDFELLSAYLDQELDPASQRQLEARLKSIPELRSALRDLQHTRQMLRAAPRYRAPRYFTLTPQMVGIKSGSERPVRRIYPVFQFASALASLLFVLVLLGDLVTSIRLFGGASAPTMMEAREQALEVVITKEVQLESAGEQDMLAPQATPTAMPAANAAATQGVVAGSPSILPETPASEEAASKMPPTAQELTPTPSPTPTLAPTITPLPPSAVAAPAEQKEGISLRSRIFGEDNRISWRFAEILLAVLAIGSGFVAVYYRRKIRR